MQRWSSVSLCKTSKAEANHASGVLPDRESPMRMRSCGVVGETEDEPRTRSSQQLPHKQNQHGTSSLQKTEN